VSRHQAIDLRRGGGAASLDGERPGSPIGGYHMTRHLAVLALLAAAAAAQAADPKALVGSWAMELDPAQVMILKGDGSGSLAGQPIRWQVRGDQLAVTDAAGATDVNGVRLQGDQLVIVGGGGLQVGFRRVAGAPRGGAGTAAAQAGGAGRGPAPTSPAAAPAGQGSALDQKVRQLLLSSAWCSFSYSSTPGGGGYGDRSSSGRVVFQADGTGYRGSSSESYSTGSGGQYAGAGRGGKVFRWQVREGRLLVDSGAGLQDVNLQGKQNSSGYPILTTGGVEYMMCR
jgi:hypothetical protein